MNPARFDRALGDPLDGEGPFSFRRAMEADEREEYPAEASAQLDALGLSRLYVPASLGGDLRSYEELGCAMRAVARRDLTLAIGHGKTVLGSQPVFLAGDDAVRREVAARIRTGEPIALALTERDNGSDLLASATRATSGARRAITGEKWLINNATRAPLACVFARTRPEGGPRGFSLFLADKREMGSACTTLPKVRTHGIRGADISGIRFDDAPCTRAPIGGEGGALAAVLRTFVVTRTLLAGVAVGAVDAALRIVVPFARRRTLYGASVLEIPHARDLVADAVARNIGCEAAALAGARMLQTAPGQATFWSSVLKFHVPTAAERTLRDLALVFGARHYLREEAASGMFQKILRDAAILSVFDGNTAVNLAHVALHAGAVERGLADAPPADAFRILDRSSIGPELDGAKIAVVAPRVVGAEALAAHALDRLDGRPHDATLRPWLEALATEAASARAELLASVAPGAGATATTSQRVALSTRYADLAAVALSACAFVYARSDGGATDRVLDEGDWLVLSLAGTLGKGAPAALLDQCRARLLDFAFGAIEAKTAISIVRDPHED